jgi:hypothetical protein
MRDKLINNSSYYNDFIEQKKLTIKEVIESDPIDSLTTTQIHILNNIIFSRSLEMLVGMYSRGDSIDELKKVYSKTIQLMERGWDDSLVKFKMGHPVKILDQYWLYTYCYMIWMLSLALLLKVPINEANILRKLIEEGMITDELILFLLGHLVSCSYPASLKTTYNPFSRIIPKQGFDYIDSKHIKKYLTNWYKNTKLHTWHNYLNNVEKLGGISYFGYWSFETAAVVAILGLDDKSFRDNPYYPKDLVDYYRANS